MALDGGNTDEEGVGDLAIGAAGARWSTSTSRRVNPCSAAFRAGAVDTRLDSNAVRNSRASSSAAAGVRSSPAAQAAANRSSPSAERAAAIARS